MIDEPRPSPSGHGPTSISESLRRPRCLLLALLAIATIAIFHMEFDGYAVVGSNLLPSDPTAFTRKQGKQSLRLTGPASSGGTRFTLGAKERIEFRMAAPAAGQLLKLSARIRTMAVQPGDKPWKSVRLLFLPLDAQGKRIAGPRQACRLQGDNPWTACTRVFTTPPGAETLVIGLHHSGVSGTAELELPVMTAAVVQPWHGALRSFLILAWIAGAIACILQARLWRSPAGWPLLLVSAVICAGVLMPKNLVKTLMSQGAQVLAPDTELNSSPPATGGSHQKDAPRPKAGPQPGMNRRLLQKGGHALLFAMLGGLALLALLHTEGGEPGGWKTMAMLITIALFAASTEVLQMLTTDRGPSWRDLMIDLGGATAGLFIVWVGVLALRPWRQGDAP